MYKAQLQAKQGEVKGEITDPRKAVKVLENYYRIILSTTLKPRYANSATPWASKAKPMHMPTNQNGMPDIICARMSVRRITAIRPGIGMRGVVVPDVLRGFWEVWGGVGMGMGMEGKGVGENAGTSTETEGSASVSMSG